MRYLVLSYDSDGSPFCSDCETAAEAEALARAAAADGMLTYLLRCLRCFEPPAAEAPEQALGVCPGRDFPATLHPEPRGRTAGNAFLL